MNLQDYESAIADQLKKPVSKGFDFSGIDYLETLFNQNNPALKGLIQEDIAEYFRRIVSVVFDNMTDFPLDLTNHTGDTIANNIYNDVIYISQSMLPKIPVRAECYLVKESNIQGHLFLVVWLTPPGVSFNNFAHVFTKMKACIVKQGNEYKNSR